MMQDRFFRVLIWILVFQLVTIWVELNVRIVR